MSFRVLLLDTTARKEAKFRVQKEGSCAMHRKSPGNSPRKVRCFINGNLEHASIKEMWLGLVLADNGISNFQRRELMRRVDEFGEATATSTEKPPYSLRKLCFR